MPFPARLLKLCQPLLKLIGVCPAARYEKYTVIKDETKLAKAADAFSALHLELIDRINDLSLVRELPLTTCSESQTTITKMR